MLTRIGGFSAMVLLGGVLSCAPAQEKITGPVRVKIEDEKPQVVEATVSIDPVKHVECTMATTATTSKTMALRVSVEGVPLHSGYVYTHLKIGDNFPMGMLQMETDHADLPATASGAKRDGFLRIGSVAGIRITQMVEVVATRAAKGGQRRRDAVLIRYILENKDTVPHQVGLRCWTRCPIGVNGVGSFAAPNQPGKILDGVELKGHTMPDYLQLRDAPGLRAPEVLGHLTFNVGPGVEAPNRVVLTRYQPRFNTIWNIAVLPALGGRSALAFYWDPRELKPGARRELAYAFGRGLAPKLGGEGGVKVDLVGSFAPKKMFTINAFVNDSVRAQSLTLDLPAGLERLEGKETQPVPDVDAEGTCLIQWKARVLRPGQYHLRIHSSTGAAQTKIITVALVN